MPLPLRSLLRTYPFVIFLLTAAINVSFSQVPNDKQSTLRAQLQTNRRFTNTTLPGYNNSNNASRIQKPQEIATSFLDTCATYTFRLTIGTVVSNEEVTEITTLRSGEMLLTGKTNKNNSQDDALLAKLDANGNVLWIKTFGENDKQEIFVKARETSDGGIIAIGTAYDLSFATAFILVCKTDGNGNLQWSRRFKSVSDVLGRGADIIELNSKNLAFLGDNSKDLLYGKLSPGGNLIWNQKINVSKTTQALSIIEDYNGWFITSTGIDTGWHVSNVIKVDSGNGNFIWRRRFGGSNMNAHYIFQKCEFINLRPRISGIYSAAGQPYQFMRVNVNTSSLIESIEQYSTPGVTIDTTSNIVLTPWSEALAFSPTNNSSDVFMFRHVSDLSTSWAYSYTATSNVRVSAMERTHDAGLIAACNLSNNSANDILLIKVDSAGLSPGCDGAPFSISSKVFRPDIPGPSAASSNETLVFDNSFIPSSNIQLATAFYCRQLTCPTPPMEDTCLVTFHKNYRSYDFADVSSSFSITNDNYLILSGLNRDNAYEPSTQKAFIIKTDDKGNLVIKKRFLIDQNCVILKQVTLADNNILVTGWYRSAAGGAGFFLLKLDNNLNVLWSKTYPIAQPSWSLGDITEADDGSIFLGLSYFDFPTLNDRMVLLKFDGLGNFLWQKMYRSSGAVSLFDQNSNLVSSGSDVYFVSHLFNDVDQRWNTLISRIDQASGNLIWSKRYSYAGHNTESIETFRLKNNSLYLHGFIDMPSQTYQSLMIIDPAGNIQKLKIHTTPISSTHYVSAEASNSDILLSGYFYDYTATTPGLYDVFLRLDNDLNIRYSKKQPIVGTGWASEIKEDHRGYPFVYGYNYYENAYNDDLFMRKYNPDGRLGTCPSDTFTFDQPVINLAITNQGMTTINGPSLSPVVTSVTEFIYSLQQNTLKCGSAIKCDTIWLKGPVTVCDSTNVYAFHANKNAECTAPVSWLYNLSDVKVQEKSDSVLKVKFIKSGLIKIKAQLSTGCRILEDSANVSVKISPAQFSFGADTTLCSKSNLLLHVPGGFNSYLWQDGSSDTSFLVTTPGQYFVQASNSCGNSYRDTINIALTATKCDTIFLKGPSTICDSTNVYAFHANKSLDCTAPVNWLYNVSEVKVQEKNDSVLKVKFVRNGLTKIKVQLFTGCSTVDDSINATVKFAPSQLSLGADTSLCLNNIRSLHVPSGFDSYLWQDGSSDTSFLVTSPGEYFVQVTNSCMDIYRDTITITAAPPIPLDLGPDRSKCNNDSLTLAAPGGFMNYSWSPNYNIGSIIGQSVTVFPGSDTIYKVSAEKTPGCFAYDSIRIHVNRSPIIDLGIDNGFCQGDSLVLSAGSGFTGYQWNSGQGSAQITVRKTGSYMVAAIDSKNCVSRDTILITVYNTPAVKLAKDSVLCLGASQQLNAGAGFRSYQWSTGSTGQSISVDVPGTYWVQVTDTRGCVGSDTSRIVDLLPPPSKFLPPDTVVCAYQSIQLKALRSYKKYLWSTGSASPAISVSQGGVYWLQVTDNFNCAGKDTIVVNPKQCNEGFFIPNAFTPNKDGNNDIFRPLLFGNVAKYHFIIYNRWGQKVFETTEVQKGWDGKVNGIEQSTFVFVWECFYEFEGANPVFRKGTATLIR